MRRIADSEEPARLAAARQSLEYNSRRVEFLALSCAGMKILKFLTLVVVVLMACMFTSGCATPPGARRVQRFHDAGDANVVLRFASWNYIFMVKPDYSENGFLRQITRDNVKHAIEAMNVPRDTAVVTVGWTYSPEALSHVVAEWNSILNSCGFRRIVMLRAMADYRLNGAPVIEDTVQFASLPRQTASLDRAWPEGREVALVAPAAGADAPHPSGDSIPPVSQRF